jgi:hypothetical protein
MLEQVPTAKQRPWPQARVESGLTYFQPAQTAELIRMIDNAFKEYAFLAIRFL